jgi:hypothetical protein
MFGTVPNGGAHPPLIPVGFLIEQADHGVVHHPGLLELPAGIEQGLPRNSDELRPAMCPALDAIGDKPGSC